MPDLVPITVVSYIPGKGALVHIGPDCLPGPVQPGRRYSARIELVSPTGTTATYDMTFEPKPAAQSATGHLTPAIAMGLIEGLEDGPPTLDAYRILDMDDGSGTGDGTGGLS